MASKNFSKLATNGRVTIPAVVREKLRLQAGDVVKFKLVGRMATVSKLVGPAHSLKSLSDEVFADWYSAEDERAFRDL